jgi:large subunit ribosomal protein L47
MHCSSSTLLTGAFGPALGRTTVLPPSFLIPSFTSITTRTDFSTSSPAQARKDGNPSRGVSALRRTGLGKRQQLSVFPSKDVMDLRMEDLKGPGMSRRKRMRLAIYPSDIPQPVQDPSKRSAVRVDENHGLWDFFHRDRSPLWTPEQLSSHGRSWTVQELRRKDWDDLHRLWWTCIKESNRMLTFKRERARVGNMYGDYEADNRNDAVGTSMGMSTWPPTDL